MEPGNSQYFAWQNLVQAIVGEPGLKPGKQLRITFGDRRGGSRGWRVQPFDETHYGFKCYVDVAGNGEYLPIEESPTVEIVAAAPTKLTVLMPSITVVGQPCWCLVRAEDRFGNPAPQYRGKVRLTSTDSMAELPEAFTFTAEDQGVHRFENIVFRTPGDHTVSVTDGDLTDRSNPVRVAKHPPVTQVFWGICTRTRCSPTAGARSSRPTTSPSESPDWILPPSATTPSRSSTRCGN